MTTALSQPLNSIRRSLTASIMPAYASVAMAEVRSHGVSRLASICGPEGSLRPAAWSNSAWNVDVMSRGDGFGSLNGRWPTPPHVHAGIGTVLDVLSAPLQNALREVRPVADLLLRLNDDKAMARYLWRLLCGDRNKAKLPGYVPPGQGFYIRQFEDWLLGHMQFGTNLPDRVALIDEGVWPERWAHLPRLTGSATVTLPTDTPRRFLRWLAERAGS